MDVRINAVSTELIVTEGVGSLGPEEVKRLVAMVLEEVRREQDRNAQRERDVGITNRALRPGGERLT